MFMRHRRFPSSQPSFKLTTAPDVVILACDSSRRQRQGPRGFPVTAEAVALTLVVALVLGCPNLLLLPSQFHVYSVMTITCC